MSVGRNHVWKAILEIGKEDAIPKDHALHIIANEALEDLSIINYLPRQRENNL